MLLQPYLEFRGMAAETQPQPPAITRNWPRHERERLAAYTAMVRDPKLIVALPNRYGTTGFARCTLSDEDYAILFESMFRGDLAQSGPVFDKIFEEHPWRVGKNDPDDGGWNGPGGDAPVPGGPPQDEVDRLSFEINATPLERAQRAFLPKAIPIVVFETEQASLAGSRDVGEENGGMVEL